MTLSGPLPSAIVIRQLTKTYGEIKALDQIALEVRQDEFLTLLGPSGSGKSTLLMILAGFIRPTSGSVRFGQREMVLVPPHKRDVGVVFQNYALFPHMNVLGNVAYPLRMRNFGRSDILKRVQTALELVRLPDFMSRRIDELSGGQQQRVAIARAIVFEPKILLMDEPLSALDKKLREEMQIELRHLHKKLGITTVYVTHDQREALTISDRVAVVNKGRIAQIGTPEDLYERPDNKFVASFVGESTLLDVQVRKGAIHLFDRAWQLSDQTAIPDGNAHLVIRPEKLDLVRDNAARNGNCIDGVLREIVYQGDSLLLRISLKNEKDIFMRASSNKFRLDTTLKVGNTITMSLGSQDIIIVPTDGSVVV